MNAPGAIIPEVFAGLSAFGIQRDQARIDRAGKYPRGAFGSIVCLSVLPVRDAATRILIGRIAVGWYFGIIAPFLLAGARIDRNDLIKLGAKNQRVFDQYRSGLKGAA